MNLLIHGRTLQGSRTGVGRYLSNLLRVWTEVYTDNIYNIYFRDSSLCEDEFLDKHNVISHTVPSTRFLNFGPVWENIPLPIELKKNKGADLYFTPEYNLPISKLTCPSIVTIFDISYIAHPEWFPKRQLASLVPLTKLTVNRASRILTGSEATKSEILKFYNIDPEKIHVTNLGVDKRFEDLEKANYSGLVRKVKERFNIKGKMILFVGLVMNRRNLPVLMESVSKLKSKGEEVTLVVLGKNHTHPYFDINNEAEKFGIKDEIRWIEYTDDETVFSLYKAADVFMCISLYEGFNITPLEAMYLGVPVICSNLSSLPEVVGDAAYLIEDPRDPLEMTKAINTVLSDENQRLELIDKGKKQAEKFSWERCSRETMDVIKGVI